MYLMRTVRNEEMVKEATAQPPFGPGFAPELVKQATRMEVMGTEVTDPSPDFVEFHLFKGPERLATRQVDGY